MKNKQQLTVKDLRLSGIKVRVQHFRYPTLNSDLASLREIREVWGDLTRVETRGGKSVVEIRNLDGKEYTATAECSVSQNFNRKLGLKIALGRALKKLRKNEKSK